MTLFNWRKWSLTVSLSVAMTILVIIAVTGVTLLSIDRETANFRDELQGQATVITGMLEIVVQNPLYELNTDFLADGMGTFGDSGVAVGARVYDPTGRLIVDETGRPAFSLNADPLGEELIVSEDMIYRWTEGSLLAGKAIKLGSRTIGALSVELPTVSLVEKTNAATNQGLTIAVIAGIIGVATSLVVSRTIALPLRSMTATTRRITEGDLTQRVKVGSGAELMALADAFNHMTAHLQENIEQLESTNSALQVARDEALGASRIKDEFLATMSHELRTPLTAIIGFGGIMLEGMAGAVDDTAKNMIQSIYDNGQHLLGLINDILDISKIEAGRLEIVYAPLETRQVIDEWRTRMRVLADRKNIGFEVEIDSDLPQQVTGDKERITQIVFNLLSNAVKFTDEGKITLNAGWDDGKWIIKVSDTGVGIPPHALQYIFEEFRQVDGSSKRLHEGTGLGLAIVRKLCRLMNGDVSVDSRTGAGSVFTVRLPVRAVVVEKV